MFSFFVFLNLRHYTDITDLDSDAYRWIQTYLGWLEWIWIRMVGSGCIWVSLSGFGYVWVDLDASGWVWMYLMRKTFLARFLYRFSISGHRTVPFLDFWAHKVAKFGLMLTKSPEKTVFISQNSKNGTEKSIFLDSRVCFRAQTLRAKRQNGLDHLRLYLTLQNWLTPLFRRCSLGTGNKMSTQLRTIIMLNCIWLCLQRKKQLYLFRR